MQCLVAYGAVKAAGFLNTPVLDNVPHKEARAEDIEVTTFGEDKALIVKEWKDLEIVNKVKVAVVGASSTTGLMIVDMLVSRYISFGSDKRSRTANVSPCVCLSRTNLSRALTLNLYHSGTDL